MKVGMVDLVDGYRRCVLFRPQQNVPNSVAAEEQTRRQGETLAKLVCVVSAFNKCGVQQQSAEYEDSNYYSFDSGGRSLYSSRSMTALNIIQNEEKAKIEQRRSVDSCSSRIMVVNSDFDPTVDDELKVRKGDIVKALYRDCEWLFVVRQNGSEQRDISDEGFIPIAYCRELESKNQNLSIFKKPAFNRSSERKNRETAEERNSDASDKRENTSTSKNCDDDNRPNSRATIQPKALMNVDRFLRSLEENKKTAGLEKEDLSTTANYARICKEAKLSYGSITEFRKHPRGRLIARFDFYSQNEDDVDIRKGDILLLLNNDDPDWYWVKRKDGLEGFVPSSYVRRVDEDNRTSSPPQKQAGTGTRNSCIRSPAQEADDPVPFSELVVISHFEPEAADDLQVAKGDWIYSYQTTVLQGKGWLWAYCPRTKRYGFVPSSIVRAPAATCL